MRSKVHKTLLRVLSAVLSLCLITGSSQAPGMMLAGAHDWILPPNHSQVIAARRSRFVQTEGSRKLYNGMQMFTQANSARTSNLDRRGLAITIVSLWLVIAVGAQQSLSGQEPVSSDHAGGKQAEKCGCQEASLHELIDDHIEAGWKNNGVNPSDAAPAAEFLRRVCLDLTGIIPTADEARAFLDDDTPDKREKLINRLLDSPEYALHMARVFDVMLTERRVATIRSYDAPTAKWREYLAASFAEDKPWDQLVREILSSDGADAKSGPAAKFYLSRDVKPDLLTRDVSRLFLGRDLQCAQCHDDIRYDDYKQADYYGIYAFLSRLSLFHDKETKQTLLAEKADGTVAFTSVFSGEKGEANPRLPGGEMIPDPALGAHDGTRAGRTA